jgi:hypothetical protein
VPRPGRSSPPGMTRYPLSRRLGGTQCRSGRVRKISPPPGFDPRTVQPVETTINTRLQKVYWLIADLTVQVRKLPSVLIVSGWDSSSGTATRYGLDGPGIESRWGRYFPHPSTPTLGPTQPPIQWVAGLSLVESGRGVALTTHLPSSAEVKERV